MGIFTWKFADDRRKRLQYGGKGYIAMPDGSFIGTDCYGGYGMFGSHDAYDVVTDLNKPYLDKVFADLEVRHPDGFFGSDLKDIAIAYMNDDEELRKKLLEEYDDRFGWIKPDWKRNIGITIACMEEDNEKLPFPLKIVSTTSLKVPYAKLPISISTQ